MLILWDTYANGAAEGHKRHPTWRHPKQIIGLLQFPFQLKTQIPS